MTDELPIPDDTICRELLAKDPGPSADHGHRVLLNLAKGAAKGLLEERAAHRVEQRLRVALAKCVDNARAGGWLWPVELTRELTARLEEAKAFGIL